MIRHRGVLPEHVERALRELGVIDDRELPNELVADFTAKPTNEYNMPDFDEDGEPDF